MWISCRTAQEIRTDTTARMLLECSPISGLEPGQCAVLELLDRVHIGQDRAIVRHHIYDEKGAPTALGERSVTAQEACETGVYHFAGGFVVAEAALEADTSRFEAREL